MSANQEISLSVDRPREFADEFVVGVPGEGAHGRNFERRRAGLL